MCLFSSSICLSYFLTPSNPILRCLKWGRDVSYEISCPWVYLPRRHSVSQLICVLLDVSRLPCTFRMKLMEPIYISYCLGFRFLYCHAARDKLGALKGPCDCSLLEKPQRLLFYLQSDGSDWRTKPGLN